MFIRLAMLVLYFLCQNTFAESVKLKYPSCVNSMCLDSNELLLRNFLKTYGKGELVYKKYRKDGNFQNSYCYYDSKDKFIVYSYNKEQVYFDQILVTFTSMCDKTDKNKFIYDKAILNDGDVLEMSYSTFISKFKIDKELIDSKLRFKEYLGERLLLDNMSEDELDAKFFYFKNGKLHSVIYSVSE